MEGSLSGFEAMNTVRTGWVLKHCPATSNLPTAMSQGAWDSLCKSTMQRECGLSISGREKTIKSLCSVCKGKTPPDKLTIIDLKMEINDMQPKKDKRGACEACGDVLLLKLSNGKQLCGKCSTIYSNTRNWLPVVEASLIYFYPERYGVSDTRTQVTTGSPSVIDQSVLQDECEKLRSDLYDAHMETGAHKAEADRHYTQLLAIRSALGITDPSFDIVASISELAQGFDRYKVRCEALVQENNVLANQHGEAMGKLKVAEEVAWIEEPSMSPPAAPAKSIDKHLLDLTLMIMKRGEEIEPDQIATWIEGVREAA